MNENLIRFLQKRNNNKIGSRNLNVKMTWLRFMEAFVIIIINFLFV